MLRSRRNDFPAEGKFVVLGTQYWTFIAITYFLDFSVREVHCDASGRNWARKFRGLGVTAVKKLKSQESETQQLQSNFRLGG